MCSWWEVGTNQGKVMADERNVWGVKPGYLSVVEYTVSVWDLEYGQLLSRSRPMPESVDLVSNHLQLFIWFVGWNFFYTTAVVCPRPRSLRSRGFREFARGFPKGTPMGKLRDRDLDYELWDEVLLFRGWPQVEEIAFQKSLGYLVMMAQNRPQWARNENCMLKPFFYEKVCFQFTNRSELN